MNGIWEGVVKSIPQEEQDEVWGNVLTLAREVTEYNHSALGIVKSLVSDYGDMELDAENIRAKIADPKNLELLKGIMDKMG